MVRKCNTIFKAAIRYFIDQLPSMPDNKAVDMLIVRAVFQFFLSHLPDLIKDLRYVLLCR